MKLFKRLLCAVLAAVMVMTFTVIASAESDKTSGEIKLMSYNVDGLPIPAFLSNHGRSPSESTKAMLDYINYYEPDILAVQEDFNYHSILKNGIDLEYKTITSGVVPFGDGLNFFSKFPIYNTERFPWNDSHGIFDDGSDELTPKGILYSVLEISEGVYVDIYNIHADGYEDDESVAARINQYHQLIDTINTVSKDRPVIIIGDTNSRFCREYTQLRKLFIEQEGFKDAWVEVCDEGKYTVWDSETSANAVYGGEWWGIWDSVDRVMYRDGGGVSFEALSHEFKNFGTEDVGFYTYEALSDHAALLVTLKYTVNEQVEDTREYTVEKYNPFTRFASNMRYLSKTLSLLLSQLPKLISGEIEIELKP